LGGIFQKKFFFYSLKKLSVYKDKSNVSTQRCNNICTTHLFTIHQFLPKFGNMKKIVLILTMITGIAISANAQTKQETQVTAAVEKMRLAMISGQKADLDAVASDDLTYGHSSGKLQTKAEFIESFVTKASVFVTITLTEQTVKVTGNTAIVRHKLAATTADGGKPGTVNLGIMLVFVKQHGEWKLLARQAYKLPVA
jgi:ketosteroid isomerase-like protein